MKYEYYINIDERGEFNADVRDSNGVTIFEISGFDIFENGFMDHKKDVDNLHDHLFCELGLIKRSDKIVLAN